MIVNMTVEMLRVSICWMDSTCHALFLHMLYQLIAQVQDASSCIMHGRHKHLAMPRHKSHAPGDSMHISISSAACLTSWGAASTG